MKKPGTPAYRDGLAAGERGDDDTTNPHAREWYGWGRTRKKQWEAGWIVGMRLFVERKRGDVISEP